ncbi:MAG: GAF domain-containing protein, partial [Candidatus Eisenbacteria bacterium]|nr:GAF domain-containing protein [Candidatus Eisenbacteria bacterium]
MNTPSTTNSTRRHTRPRPSRPGGRSRLTEWARRTGALLPLHGKLAKPEVVALLLTISLGVAGWLGDAYMHSHVYGDGTFLEMAVTAVPPHAFHVRTYVGLSLGILGLGLYATIRRLGRSTKRIERANSVLRAVHEASHAKEPPEKLIQHICETFCQSSGFRFMWGVLLDPERNLTAYSSSGRDGRFTEMVDDWKAGNPPGCAALRGQPPCTEARVCSTDTCAGCSISHRAESGVMSISVPIDIGSRRHGVLSALATRRVATDRHERALLETVARDVAALLESREAESVRQASEAALRTSERHSRLLARDLDRKLRAAEYRHVWEVHASSPTPAMTADADGAIVDYNEAMSELTGYDREEVSDVRTLAGLLSPDEARRAALTKALYCPSSDANTFTRVLLSITDRAGGRRSVELMSTALTHDGEPTGVRLLQAIDVTEDEETREALRWESEVNLALAVLSNTLLGTHSLREVGRAVLKAGKRLTHSEHGYVASIDPATGEAVNHTITDMMGKACDIALDEDEPRFPVKEDGTYPSLWGHVLNTREAFYTNDPASHPSSTGLPDGHVPLGNFIAAPALIGGELVGQIALSGAPGGYSVRDLAAVKRLADLLALAIQRSRVELELEEERDRARDYLDIAGSIIVAIDPDERVSMINRAGCEVLECSEDEAVGANWFQTFIPSDERERVRKIFHELLDGQIQAHGTVENEVLTATGKRRWIAWHNALRYDAAGDVVGTLGSGEDITEHRWRDTLLRTLNETALAIERAMETEEVFRTVGAKLQELGFGCAVFGIDRDSGALTYRYTSIGERLIFAAEMLTGLRAESYRVDISESENLSRVVRGKQTLLHEKPGGLAKALLPGSAKRFASRIAKLVKLPRTALAPIIAGEEVIGVLAVMSERLSARDLPTIEAFSGVLAAGWKKTDLLTRLRSSLDELERTQQKLVQAQKLEAIGKLAGGVAHDFNNLLTVISGYTELLSRSAEDARVSAHAEQIRGAAERAADLTQQLLAFSRQQPLQPRVVEANSAITSMNALLRRLIGEDIALSVHLSPEAGRIRVDPAQIEQVVMNLAVNARDAMPEGGALTLRTEHVVLNEDDVEEKDQARAGSYVMLAVSDTGTGIDKEALDRIFEPFYSTKELGRGTGLGLSVVYGVV